MKLRRVYFLCKRCGSGGFAWDEHWGVQGSITEAAQRVICLAGASWSFDRASAHLKEFLGWSVSDTTIRQVCDRRGGQMRRWQQEAPQAGEAFRKAEGEVEFYTDGAQVNTMQGWREMRLNIFAKRRRGQPATPAQWDRRKLPAPHVRVAFAGIRTSESLGRQWRRQAARLGIRRTEDISVLADAARWIWKQIETNLPGAKGVLDIYHGLEHLRPTAVALYGEGAEEVELWVAAQRTRLLEGGAPVLLDELERQQRPIRSPKKRRALQALWQYFDAHREHTAYRERLAAGEPIGSGLVEGGCKQVIGRRLKQTGARWRCRRADRMASLCTTLYSDLWEPYWHRLAA